MIMTRFLPAMVFMFAAWSWSQGLPALAQDGPVGPGGGQAPAQPQQADIPPDVLDGAFIDAGEAERIQGQLHEEADEIRDAFAGARDIDPQGFQNLQDRLRALHGDRSPNGFQRGVTSSAGGFSSSVGGAGGGTVFGNNAAGMGSFAQGMGEFAHGIGSYNLNTAQAAVIAEEARSAYYDNRLRHVSTRYEMRKINDAYRRSQRPGPATKEEMVRFAAMNDPKPLTAEHVNPATGELIWPRALKGAEFADERAAMEALWTKKDYVPFASRDAFEAKAETLGKDLTADLRARVRKADPADWIEAKNFVASVVHEISSDSQAGLALASR
jgi:hypothetical protein